MCVHIYIYIYIHDIQPVYSQHYISVLGSHSFQCGPHYLDSGKGASRKEGHQKHIFGWIPFGDHPLKLERYRED